jgi:hypothetical protein
MNESKTKARSETSLQMCDLLEVYLRCGISAFEGFKERFLFKAEYSGDHIGWNPSDFFIVLFHDRVEVSSNSRDTIFSPFDLSLER